MAYPVSRWSRIVSPMDGIIYKMNELRDHIKTTKHAEVVVGWTMDISAGAQFPIGTVRHDEIQACNSKVGRITLYTQINFI